MARSAGGENDRPRSASFLSRKASTGVCTEPLDTELFATELFIGRGTGGRTGVWKAQCDRSAFVSGGESAGLTGPP